MKHPFLTLVLATLVAAPALPTWSIVCVDRSTGEACVATATCLTNFDIRASVPVLVVGKGAGAVQSSGDVGVTLRSIIFEGLLADQPPERIIKAVKDAPGIANQNRQYGIAGMAGLPRKFTGIQCGEAAPDTRGRLGSIDYAMQGNVLAGDAVLAAAEAAFRAAEGDLSQRVMAAMEAARSFGGDGRCSCSQTMPTGCGAPPPSFDKSAHCAMIALARLGDVDGDCVDPDLGCVNGDYYLNLQFVGLAADPDPVLELQALYDTWRDALVGVPDHVLSQVSASAEHLPADGLTQAQVEVRLIDVEGVPLTSSAGLDLAVSDVSPAGPVAIPGPVTNLGDGRFQFALTATHQPGPGLYQLVVEGGPRDVQLAGGLAVTVDPPAELHAGSLAVDASEPVDVPFVLDLGAGLAGTPYLVLGSAAGTHPGTPWDGGTLPLNADRFLGWTLGSRELFLDSAGLLDGAGRATARLRLRAGLLAPFIGGRLQFCAVIDTDPDGFTNVAGFLVVP